MSLSWLRLSALRITAALLGALGCLGLVAAGGARATTVTELRLVATSGYKDLGEVGQLRYRPAISADGRFVAWIGNPGLLGTPLYMRNLDSGRSWTITPPSGTDAYSGFTSETPAFSADGRYLAFATDWRGALEKAGVKPGKYTVQNVFVFDRVTGAYRLVSRRNGPRGAPGEENSTRPSISEDGAEVAFTTESSNLAPPGPERIGGDYLRNLRREENRIVSAPPGIYGPSSFAPDISGNGRRVAYGTQYRQKPRSRFHKEVMLWDPRWKKPKLVSRAAGPAGKVGNDDCIEASASRTGRYIAFACKATNLVPGDRNGVEDVFVRDTVGGTTRLVSSPGGKPISDGDSSAPSISANGRYVAFQSDADNLLPGDPDTKSGVFVKDMRTGSLTLVSAAPGGLHANSSSGTPTITPDGRFVAFVSRASNLSPEDATHDLAVYRARLSP